MVQRSPREQSGGTDHDAMPAAEVDDGEMLPPGVIPRLRDLYEKALSHDPYDIEANFNLGRIQMQTKDYNNALASYRNCVRKDLLAGSNVGERSTAQHAEISQIFKNQFQKAYFNIGIIHDRLGDIDQACAWYEKAIERGLHSSQHGDGNRLTFMAGNLDWDHVFLGDRPNQCAVKAACNLAVCYEKIGNRDGALAILNGLKEKLSSNQYCRRENTTYLEGLANNLGVIYKRQGLIKEAEEAFRLAILLQNQRSEGEKILANDTEPNKRTEVIEKMQLIKFFPLYNLAVAYSKNRQFDEAIKIFNESL